MMGVCGPLLYKCVNIPYYLIPDPICGFPPQHAGHLCAGTKVKGKGKAILLQAWTGPEGSRRLRLPDFKTIGI